MSDSFENALRKGMVALGHVVEKVIGKARQASVQVQTRSGVQPVLSIESQLTAARMRDVIEASAQKILSAVIPDLKGKSAFEVGEGPGLYNQRLLSNDAKIVVAVEAGGASVGRQGDSSRGFVVRASFLKLPFQDRKFSYFIARLATHLQSDMVRTMRELGRLLEPGGQGVVVDYHPFGPYTKRGTGRVRSADSGIHKFEDYYRVCKQAGLRVVDVREAFIDEGSRQLFRESELAVYRSLKGTPLLACIFVYKPKGNA